MVLKYSEEAIDDIISSKEFLNCFEENYNNEKKQSLINFLDNIETNKKYYNLGIQKSKRFRKNENGDTLINIQVHNKNQNFRFELKNKRNLDRKTLNLLRNKEISAIID